jgi:hypothetical protein
MGFGSVVVWVWMFLLLLRHCEGVEGHRYYAAIWGYRV